MDFSKTPKNYRNLKRKWCQFLLSTIAAYLIQYGQVLRATSDNLNVGSSFDIMLDFFISVANCLFVAEKNAGHCDRQKTNLLELSTLPTSWLLSKER